MDLRDRILGVDDDMVRAKIIEAYRANGWRTSQTARALDVSKHSLLRLVRQLGIRGEIENGRQAASDTV